MSNNKIFCVGSIGNTVISKHLTPLTAPFSLTVQLKGGGKIMKKLDPRKISKYLFYLLFLLCWDESLMAALCSDLCVFKVVLGKLFVCDVLLLQNSGPGGGTCLANWAILWLLSGKSPLTDNRCWLWLLFLCEFIWFIILETLVKCHSIPAFMICKCQRCPHQSNATNDYIYTAYLVTDGEPSFSEIFMVGEGESDDYRAVELQCAWCLAACSLCGMSWLGEGFSCCERSGLDFSFQLTPQ